MVVVTHLASPYQVELFNAVERNRPEAISIVYLYESSLDRQWGMQKISHESLVINDEQQRIVEASRLVEKAQLVVFNFYNHPVAIRLMRQRTRSGRPWCFWGERTGFHSKGLPGRLYRRWRLSPLHRSRAPIWGMGKLAVEQYRREFGSSRACFNVSYYSDLTRFHGSERRGRVQQGITTFLYSGALIHRKGVDLLTQAFRRLATRRADVRLRVLGDGEWKERMAEELTPVRERVEFLGFRDWHELPELYAAADVLCAPSRHDGWGLVVPEGLAAGLPVISTDATGAALELIDPRHNGWLIPSHDARSLEFAMEDAANIPEKDWPALAQRARASAASRDLPQGVVEFCTAADETLKYWNGSHQNPQPSASGQA